MRFQRNDRHSWLLVSTEIANQSSLEIQSEITRIKQIEPRVEYVC